MMEANWHMPTMPQFMSHLMLVFLSLGPISPAFAQEHDNTSQSKERDKKNIVWIGALAAAVGAGIYGYRKGLSPSPKLPEAPKSILARARPPRPTTLAKRVQFSSLPTTYLLEGEYETSIAALTSSSEKQVIFSRWNINKRNGSIRFLVTEFLHRIAIRSNSELPLRDLNEVLARIIIRVFPAVRADAEAPKNEMLYVSRMAWQELTSFVAYVSSRTQDAKTLRKVNAIKSLLNVVLKYGYQTGPR